MEVGEGRENTRREKNVKYTRMGLNRQRQSGPCEDGREQATRQGRTVRGKSQKVARKRARERPSSSAQSFDVRNKTRIAICTKSSFFEIHENLVVI